MKIAIVTVWYNEEDFAPFFLNHYDYVDRIFVLLDADTSDRTPDILARYENVVIEPLAFPDGMDDIIKVKALSHKAQELADRFDWVYALDADEFIFAPRNYYDAGVFLAKQGQLGYDCVVATMYQVYRHVTDEDLDPTKPAIYQRQHGDPNTTQGINALYNKPIVARPNRGILWGVGNHNLLNDNRRAEERMFGAHWAMAEPDIAVKRRILGRKMRQSKRNLDLKLTYHHHHITEEEIREECKQHENDPDVLGGLLP